MLLIEMSGARAALALAQVDLHRGNGGGLMASTLQLKLFAILLWAIANLSVHLLQRTHMLIINSQNWLAFIFKTNRIFEPVLGSKDQKCVFGFKSS